MPRLRRQRLQDKRMEQAGAATTRRDRLLPWIAAERAFRTLVLITVGLVLLTHPHTNWASEIASFAQRLGQDPKDNWIHRLIAKVSKISANKDVLFGAVALAYGALEGAEAYGLWKRRRWGEWLTVIATSLLFVPEVWELTKSISPLKLGALLANIAIVAYLIWQMRADGDARERTSAELA